jgi:hypothetical protein
MSWLSTLIRHLALALAAVTVFVLGACAQPALAQSLESAIMPGEVSQAHIKQEPDCKNCHVRFERSAQPRLCLDCHKPVAADVRAKTGYHGRLKEQECRTCHTEHKGRDAKIVKLDEKTFDHTQTDFALQGKHKGVSCSSCHKPKTKHSATPSNCSGCHRKDDKHKDSLGAKCEKCHSESGWKETRFDHAKTEFPLLLRHAKVKCAECHADPQHLANTSRECVSCHRKDDKHKNTLGSKCEQCHSPAGWKEARFDHAKTRFPLLLSHAKVKCAECHSDVQHFANTSPKCFSCHRKKDPHKGDLGEKCEACHNEKTWKEAARFDHDRDTKFPLREAHRKAKCDGCHKDTHVLRDKQDARIFSDKPPSACFGCHERDDREKGHKGRYGEKCQTCHVEKAFKAVIFEHARDTRFALRGKHQQVKCDSCHKGVLYRDKLQDRCFACHEPDDKHKGQLGNDCARCHSETGWRETSFDHNKSEFPLRERHAQVECKKCHSSTAFKDAKTNCASCHAKDDFHKQRLGPRCEQCHSERGWKSWEFDHNLRSRFKLVERHAKAKCLACHIKPVTDKITLATECLSCHRHDDIHFETNGAQCERCHAPDNWRHVINQESKPK